MTAPFLEAVRAELAAIREADLYKRERVIRSPQAPVIELESGERVLNFCANNYLGLANDPSLVAAAQAALGEYGFGLASVRFICGTQTVHKALEGKLSALLGTDDTILYSSCFDANGGLFETLLGEEDAVISDSLNHASIIDGVRLCKARRLRYANNDMADLEAQLRAAADARYRLIATDGVFSMDGVIADLPAICELADRHDAMVMVDDSHAVGFIGATGAGTPELHGVQDRVDVVTGTLGKALGGASGGYTSGRGPIIELLRQRSRPYLFSNSLAPAVAGATLRALELVATAGELRERLERNSVFFRERMERAGFTLAGRGHPIIPVMVGDAAPAVALAERLLEEGIYVIAFSFPVVPKGQARIRVQMSAAHERDDLERAVDAFTRCGRELGVVR